MRLPAQVEHFERVTALEQSFAQLLYVTHRPYRARHRSSHVQLEDEALLWTRGRLAARACCRIIAVLLHSGAQRQVGPPTAAHGRCWRYAAAPWVSPPRWRWPSTIC